MTSKILNHRHIIPFSCLLGGILLGLSFPPIGMYAFAWVALSPVFLSLTDASPRRAFLRAWILYSAMFAVAFYWPLFHIRPDTALISGISWIALTMMHAVPIGLGAIVARRYNLLSAIWLTGSMILVLDWLLTYGPAPMPWSSLAYTQSMNVGMIRSVAWFGSSGLSTLIVLTNVCLAVSMNRFCRHRRFWLAATVAIPALVFVAGLSQSRGAQQAEQAVLRVGVLQPGFTPEEWSSIHDFLRVDSLMTMSQSLLHGSARLDIVVWPETALPAARSIGEFDDLILKVSAWVADHRVALLTGAVTNLGVLNPDENHAQPGGFENSVMLFEADRPVQRYGKNILVPFAEYVPYSERFSKLNRLAVPSGGVSGYVPGTSPSILQLGSIQIGTLICFETAFPRYARSLITGGARLLFVITQDGWWKGPAPYYQHLYYNRLRSIETGRAIVQVGVDGISALILADGKIIDPTQPRDSTRMVFDAPLSTSMTAYVRFGDTGSLLVLGIWILLSVLHAIRYKRIETLRPDL